MKIRIAFLVAALLTACGNETETEEPTVILSEGAAFEGKVGGEVVRAFDDGSRVRTEARGYVRVDFPDEVFDDAPFPGEVTYSAVENNHELTGRAFFPAIERGEHGFFTQTIDVEGVEASIRFQLRETEDEIFVLDLNAFQWFQPATAEGEIDRTISLGGTLR